MLIELSSHQCCPKRLAKGIFSSEIDVLRIDGQTPMKA